MIRLINGDTGKDLAMIKSDLIFYLRMVPKSLLIFREIKMVRKKAKTEDRPCLGKKNNDFFKWTNFLYFMENRYVFLLIL